jgi:hypothetical protein
MNEEFAALMKNGTWDKDLVPSQPSRNLVDCKWIFKVKCHSDGSVECYKARLVVKGFSQRYGLDYAETFNPVFNPTTVRLILSIAVSRGWSIRQADVKNAFLNEELQETVYMWQPLGFVNPSPHHHVCRLWKVPKKHGYVWHPPYLVSDMDMCGIHLGYVSEPIIFNRILRYADTGIHMHGLALDTAHTAEEERRATSGLDEEGRSRTGTASRPPGTPPHDATLFLAASASRSRRRRSSRRP